MAKRPQIAITFNQEQIDHLAQESGVAIKNASDLKKAIRTRFPELPEDKRAGAPVRKRASRKQAK